MSLNLTVVYWNIRKLIEMHNIDITKEKYKKFNRLWEQGEVVKARKELVSVTDRSDRRPKRFQIEYDHMPDKALRGNSRAHWAAKIKPKEALQDETMFKLRTVRAPAMDKVRIKYIAYYCGKPIDSDNLIMGMKYAQDMLVEGKIIKDDNPTYVQGLATEYHRVKTKKEVKLIMEVTEIEEVHPSLDT